LGCCFQTNGKIRESDRGDEMKNKGDVKKFLTKIISEDNQVQKYFAWKKLPQASIDNIIDKYFDDKNTENMNDFAAAVYKLIEKFNVIVDIETSVSNRALNYIADLYDTQTAKELRNILEKDYNLFSSQQTEDETGPSAKGAGPEIT